MAEIDTGQVLIAFGIAFIGIVGTWLGSGVLARRFEKRKKKYEVKLERFSAVADGLQLLSQETRVAGCIYAMMKKVKTDRVLNNGEFDVESNLLFFEL